MALFYQTFVLAPLVLALLSVQDEPDLQCVRRGPFPTRGRVLVHVDKRFTERMFF